ncbi:MAG: excinuclease ABC subunit UvrA [Pirellulaceae bacterium]|nr:excinuclease ABC subunit UvrA [Pirellulaceae bacterium]
MASDLVVNPVAHITIEGARTHNLRNVTLHIPHNQLTVITGVSGSGKSSLAFDTLFAEGQRQYIESLSTYARQYLNPLPRPDVDGVHGLQPTLCIDQRSTTAGPRSTVATVSEVYDYLRLLMARAATPYCFKCGQNIQQQSQQQIVQSILQLPAGTKLVVLAPVVRGRRGGHRDELRAIQQAGLIRVRVDGDLLDIEAVPELNPRQNHTIEAVVDRIVLGSGSDQRLSESVAIALQLAHGLVSISYLPGKSSKSDAPQDWQERLFSSRFACASCGASFEELEPRTFSFNSPYGACPDCHGMGQIVQQVGTNAEERVEPTDTPQTCSACKGARLRPEALAVKLHDCSIADIVAKNIMELLAWLECLKWDEETLPVARPILGEMLHRLRFLVQVGVGYLTLDRPADSLSGGELQRVRLATCIGSGLVGVCYILDEPSIGLHPRDNDRLIQSLRQLQAQGNTVIVVEHDEAMMRAADMLVDMGPGAGPQGGMVIAAGTPTEVTADPRSLTGAYLRGERQVTENRSVRSIAKSKKLRLSGAILHNLDSVSVEIPLGLLVGITGVSGSGKSSLISQTLVPAILRELGQAPAARPGPYTKLTGVQHVDKLIELTQAPIGRSPRSTPATYCGAWDLIRQLWANTRDSKSRGYTAGRFSFKAGTGRCPKCQGQGQEKIEMNFLPDLFVTCSACQGQRYNRQTLQVRYRQRSIADILNMSVDQAAEFFCNFEKIHRLLTTLQQVGLGYVALGQNSATLSGGEAQRIKLATELARPETGQTIYILDEPTSGLHFEDIKRLIMVLNDLVSRGNTVIVTEHNLDVIASCDWLIDLGPDGGKMGGRIVATGTPAQIASQTHSLTGQFLRHKLTNFSESPT